MDFERAHINGKEIPDVIRNGREYKSAAKEQDLVLSGNERNVERDAALVSEVLLDDNQDWIDTKLGLIHKYFPGLEVSEVRAAYDKGLRTYVRMCYRSHKASSPDSLDIFTDTGYLEELVFSYTFDFIQNLRQAGKHGMSAPRSLEFSQKSYRHNPDVLPILHKEFPEMDPWIITHATIGYPVSASSFLEGVRSGVSALQEKFPQVNEGVIEKSVVYNPLDPEARVKGLLATLPQLAEEFPELSESSLWKAALSHPRDTSKFLRSAAARTEDLAVRYPGANRVLLEYAAINSPAMSEEFLKETIARRAALKASFPEFADSLMDGVALHHTVAPEEFLSNALKQRIELREKYPSVDNWVIDTMVINCKKPEEVLAQRLKEAGLLKERYPEVPGHVIMRHVVTSPVTAEMKIIRYRTVQKI